MNTQSVPMLQPLMSLDPPRGGPCPGDPLIDELLVKRLLRSRADVTGEFLSSRQRAELEQDKGFVRTQDFEVNILPEEIGTVQRFAMRVGIGAGATEFVLHDARGTDEFYPQDPAARSWTVRSNEHVKARLTALTIGPDGCHLLSGRMEIRGEYEVIHERD